MAKLEFINVEQTILGLLLDDGSLISQCSLSIDDFSQQSHRVIFDSINHISAKGHAVDIVSVGEHIESKYQKVDMNYLAELVSKCFGNGENMGKFCDMVKNASRMRKAKEIAISIQKTIELDGDCDNVVERAIQSLMLIDKDIKKYEHTMSECVDSALEFYDKASERGGLIGITSGLVELDEALGGFHESDLLVIGARPAMGKTALLFNFANACKVPCGIISAEQGHTQAGLRFLSIAGDINSQNIRRARMTEIEFSRLPGTVTKLKEMPIFVNDEPGINITTLMRQARAWKQNNGIQILFVDYIQKIKGSVQRQTTIDRVSEVVGSLKDLARELEIPVVALSQVNRAAEQLDHPPGPSHLSDASAVEKEADSIITMFKNVDMTAKGQILLNICKNRHGPCGDVTVNYHGPFFKFTDLSASKYEGF